MLYWRYSWLRALGLALLVLNSVLAAETAIGSVKTVQGAASIRRGAVALPAKQGMHLLPQDVLSTGGDGTIGVILHDGTRLSLNANSEIRMAEFVYQPVSGQFSLVLQLIRGAAAYVSGRIAELSPQSVKLETPVAMLGLRGTKFIASLHDARVNP